MKDDTWSVIRGVLYLAFATVIISLSQVLHCIRSTVLYSIVTLTTENLRSNQLSSY